MGWPRAAPEDRNPCIEEGQRPEPQQREPMAVERIFGTHREKIIDQGQSSWGEPQTNNIMNVQTVHGGAVDSREGLCKLEQDIAE